MCKMISALPVCCKLISRLSLLALVLKRVVANVFTCDQTGHASPDDSLAMDSSSADADADVNIIRPRPASGIRVKTRGQRRPAHTVSIGRKLARIVRALFEWPFVGMLVALIWVASLLASWPLFSSYLVRDDVCDSEFRFPEDIRAVQSLWFNYLIYGTLGFFYLSY